jgi:glutathione S-transferase
MAALKIYGIPRSRAFRPLWAAHELGIPYDLITVDMRKGEHHAPDYAALNPNLHVPTLNDDGLVLWESLAMTLYLAKKHGGPLAPIDVAEDGLMTMWSFWAVTEVEPHSMQVLYHRLLKPAEERDEATALAGIAALRRPVGILEAHLTGRPFVIGDRFTVADLNLAAVLSYAKPAPELFSGAPHVAAWLDASLARPAAKAARNG